MKKNLLLTAAFACAIGLSASAENTITVFNTYFDEKSQSNELLTGCFYSVSPNGQYAVGFDEGTIDYVTYIWSAETGKIEVHRCKNYMYFYDVANDGTCVGSFPIEGAGENGHRPGYFKDGEWHALPQHHTVASVSHTSNKAFAISPDGKYIGGIQFCEHADGGKARTYPCLWVKEGDEYVLHMYNDIELPDHQGFYPTKMSDDGRYMVGKMFSEVGSTLLAYVKDGELHHFYELETRMEIWDEDGNYYPESYINGVHDDGWLSDAEFFDIDNNGNMIGYYTHLAEGETPYSCAVMFNENENNGELQELNYQIGTVIANPNQFFVVTGAGGYFTPYYVENGVQHTLPDAFAIDDSCSIINDLSADGRVIVGAGVETFEGGGYNVPVLIQLDEELVSAKTIHNDNVSIRTSNGQIAVEGAENIAIYSINGGLISNSATANVPSGLYIVKADNQAYKIIVK